MANLSLEALHKGRAFRQRTPFFRVQGVAIRVADIPFLFHYGDQFLSAVRQARGRDAHLKKQGIRTLKGMEPSPELSTPMLRSLERYQKLQWGKEESEDGWIRFVSIPAHFARGALLRSGRFADAGPLTLRSYRAIDSLINEMDDFRMPVNYMLDRALPNAAASYGDHKELKHEDIFAVPEALSGSGISSCFYLDDTIPKICEKGLFKDFDRINSTVKWLLSVIPNNIYVKGIPNSFIRPALSLYLELLFRKAYDPKDGKGLRGIGYVENQADSVIREIGRLTGAHKIATDDLDSPYYLALRDASFMLGHVGSHAKEILPYSQVNITKRFNAGTAGVILHIKFRGCNCGSSRYHLEGDFLECNSKEKNKFSKSKFRIFGDTGTAGRFEPISFEIKNIQEDNVSWSDPKKEYSWYTGMVMDMVRGSLSTAVYVSNRAGKVIRFAGYPEYAPEIGELKLLSYLMRRNRQERA